MAFNGKQKIHQSATNSIIILLVSCFNIYAERCGKEIFSRFYIKIYFTLFLLIFIALFIINYVRSEF